MEVRDVVEKLSTSLEYFTKENQDLRALLKEKQSNLDKKIDGKYTHSIIAIFNNFAEEKAQDDKMEELIKSLGDKDREIAHLRQEMCII